MEFFIVDQKGRIVPRADEILKRVSEVAGERRHTIVKECSTHMIELGSYPDVDGSNTMKSLIEDIRLLLGVVDSAGYGVLPLGTYPGSFTPAMREAPRYKIQKAVFGRNRFNIAGRCSGYHCHYALPWGVFDNKTLMLKSLSDSRNQEYLVQAFNFLVAIDPALTTFMQSSPFYQGRQLAKDSRMIVYRAGEELGYPRSLYANHPALGSLPAYVHAGADLVSRIEDRHKMWFEILAGAGVPFKDLPEYRSMLETNWSTVKVNAHGTLEQRGMDMNRLPILFAVSTLIQVLMQNIQNGHLQIVPHDSAISQPFRREGETIYVAPDSYVKKHLQRLSAYEGLENDEVHNYCKRLVQLALQFGGERAEVLLKPLNEMLSARETVSDKILFQAKQLGYDDYGAPLPQHIACEIARFYAQRMPEDIHTVEQMIEKIAEI